MVDLFLRAVSYFFFNITNCIINNGDILTDGTDERKYLQRRHNEM